MGEIGLSHFAPHPTRQSGTHNVLSHLPLHSQQPSRAPSLLIPIGGIHMIQPRSFLPLYSLLCSPPATAANPAGTGTPRRLTGAPKARLSLLQRQDTLKGSSDPKAPGQAAAGYLLHRKRQGCFSVQQPSSLEKEMRHQEESADAPVTQRPVYPETAQGQRDTASSQTQL